MDLFDCPAIFSSRSIFISAVCVVFGSTFISGKCSISLHDDKIVDRLNDQTHKMLELHLSFSSYKKNPLLFHHTKNYKPWKWFRVGGQHGRTLLTLSFDYNIHSMSILNIGVISENVELVDSPFGCFGDFLPEERISVLRNIILNNFEDKNTTFFPKENNIKSTSQEPIYVCNEIIKDVGGYGYFGNKCCRRNRNGDTICEDQNQQFWIEVLYVSITFVKTVSFFFIPLVLPKLFLSSTGENVEYVVKLSNKIKMKMFVSKKSEPSVNYRKRLTYNDIQKWPKFFKAIHEFPQDKIVHTKLPELRITVQGKRLVGENNPPTGLLRTIYDNIVRCKIRRLDPFTECCNLGISGSIIGVDKACVTWYACLKTFIQLVILIFLPTPFYARLFIFYWFEKEEIDSQRYALNSVRLKEPFDVHHRDMTQYLSPTHGLMIVSYILYLIIGIVGSLSRHPVKENLHSVIQNSLQDMENVSYSSVLKVAINIILWPFKKFGVAAFILYPFILAISGPAVVVIIIIYCIPTVYLMFRLVYYSKMLASDSDNMEELISPQSLRRRFSDIDEAIHDGKSNPKPNRRNCSEHNYISSMEQNILTFRNSDKLYSCLSCIAGFWKIVRIWIIRITAGFFCVSCLLALLLICVEVVEMTVSFLAFTMMGIIVHAGSTLRYVSMVLLVIMYMHECFNNVYKNYMTFTSSVFEDIMDRTDGLADVARLPAHMQANFAFQLKPVDGIDTIPTALNFDKMEPRWRIGHMPLLLDSFDTPSIPLKLFQKLCQIRVHGAPGPVYVNLLRATGKFLIIVVFLFFVMIVVMAFGNMHKMSSTNQTLATLAGGFVPLLLQNVVSSKSVKLNLKTLSFQGNVDEVIGKHEQYWPVSDIVIEKDEIVTHDSPENKTDLEQNKKSNVCPENDKDAESSLIIETKTKCMFKTSGGDRNGKNGHYITDLYSKFVASTKHITQLNRGILGLNQKPNACVDVLVDLNISDKSKQWVVYDSMASISNHSSFYRSDRKSRMSRGDILIV